MNEANRHFEVDVFCMGNYNLSGYVPDCNKLSSPVPVHTRVVAFDYPVDYTTSWNSQCININRLVGVEVV